MKNSILKTVVMLLTLVAITSCSTSSSDTIIPAPVPINQDIWKINDYNFITRVSTQVLSNYTNGKPFSQVNVDSNISTTNNNFKACNLIFTFNTQIAGVYTAKTQNTLFNNVDSNFMHIKCIVTDLAGKGAAYESVDSSTTINVEKVGGKFIITAANGITLTKTLDDGLVNAPTTMVFKCDKVK
jgi:hypothetical protein